MRPCTFLLCLLAGALPGGCGDPAPGGAAGAGPGPKGAGAAEPTHRVRVVVLEPRPIEERLPCTSHVEALHEVAILSQVAGQVVAAPVDEGSRVHKGDVLFRIDDREARLNLAAARNREADAKNQAAEAALALREARNRSAETRLEAEQSKRSLDRVQRSHDKELASMIELEDAQLACDKCGTALDLAKNAEEKAVLGKAQAATAADAARIQREIQERLLEDFTVRAPISGVVARTSIRGGEWITPQTLLCTLVDDKDLVLRLNRPQKEVAKLHVGQRVDIEVDAFPSTRFAGKIDLISPVVDRDTGTFAARVRVVDPAGRLRPGMFCRAWIITGASRDALVIPKNAIVYDGDRPFAFVVRDGKAVRIAIERGISLDDALEARNRGGEPRPDAFVAGDRVISEGKNKLETGRRVQVENE